MIRKLWPVNKIGIQFKYFNTQNNIHIMSPMYIAKRKHRNDENLKIWMTFIINMIFQNEQYFERIWNDRWIIIVRNDTHILHFCVIPPRLYYRLFMCRWHTTSSSLNTWYSELQMVHVLCQISCRGGRRDNRWRGQFCDMLVVKISGRDRRRYSRWNGLRVSCQEEWGFDRCNGQFCDMLVVVIIGEVGGRLWVVGGHSEE